MYGVPRDSMAVWTTSPALPLIVVGGAGGGSSGGPPYPPRPRPPSRLPPPTETPNTALTPVGEPFTRTDAPNPCVNGPPRGELVRNSYTSARLPLYQRPRWSSTPRPCPASIAGRSSAPSHARSISGRNSALLLRRARGHVVRQEVRHPAHE